MKGNVPLLTDISMLPIPCRQLSFLVFALKIGDSKTCIFILLESPQKSDI